MQSLEREQAQRAAAADAARRLAAAERRLADLGDAEAVIARLQVGAGRCPSVGSIYFLARLSVAFLIYPTTPFINFKK